MSWGWKNDKVEQQPTSIIERCTKKFPLQLKDSEHAWLKQQSESECNSINGIVRKAIKLYKELIEGK